MLKTIFCCAAIQPYPRQTRTDNDNKFLPFVKAAQAYSGALEEFQIPEASIRSQALAMEHAFAIQLVRQVNFGPLESKRYFVPSHSQSEEQAGPYIEVMEEDLITANFNKNNSYKNFKCNVHKRFFEVNLYEKDPVSQHHWRASIARPAGQIDL